MILDRSKPRGDHRPRGSLQAVGKRVRDSRVALNKASSRLNRWRARGVRRALRAYLWPNARSAVRTQTPNCTTNSYSFDKTTPGNRTGGSAKSCGVLLTIGIRPCDTDTRFKFGGVLGSCIGGDSRTRTMRLEERQDEEKQFGSCGND